VTDAFEESIAAPRDSIRIIPREISALHFGVWRKNQGNAASDFRVTAEAP